jgi:hypothetical protein
MASKKNSKDEIRIMEFDPRSMPKSCTAIVIGPPATGKTTLMENISYTLKDRYPMGRVFMGTEEGYKRFCEIFGPLYVTYGWKEDELKSHVLRQRKCVMENGKGYPGNLAICIIDDCSDDPKIFKTPLVKGLFKNGSQHYEELLMVGLQYGIDMPPDVRKSVSYVFIGREPEFTERKKLYENFGGIVGSFENFCELMDGLTGDYTFMVIKKRSESNKLEDCVSYYRTKPLGLWKFGCKEYKEHAEKRYNKTYIDKIE